MPQCGPGSAAMRSAMQFLLISILAGLAAAFLISRLTHYGLPHRTELANAPSQQPSSYASAVRRASPAVVSIFADKLVTEQQLGVLQDPTMKRFLGVTPLGPARQRLEQSLGSAVIVQADGTMVTNDHVVAGFDNIHAVLWDGRIAKASVIGRDAISDLAVLKIDLSDLPAAQFAESAKLEVGDVVLAIGNPYGYSQTVTSGIVSALGRTDQRLSTYIQTDAAISVGNSGGALINAAGDLVGINTAALDRVDAGIAVPGISFAIPADVVQRVLREILQSGEVTRGWIGVECAERMGIDASSARPARMVYIAALYQNAPAARAGLMPGDQVKSLAGKPIESLAQFRAMEAELEPGSTLTLALVRDGIAFNQTLQVTRRPRFEK
jgi:serine protease DegQ